MPHSPTTSTRSTFELREARLRVEAVQRVIEHDIVFGDGSLDADTTFWAAGMLAQAERFFEIAKAAA